MGGTTAEHFGQTNTKKDGQPKPLRDAEDQPHAEIGSEPTTKNDPIPPANRRHRVEQQSAEAGYIRRRLTPPQTPTMSWIQMYSATRTSRLISSSWSSSASTVSCSISISANSSRTERLSPC